jgi:hypothetical protein
VLKVEVAPNPVREVTTVTLTLSRPAEVGAAVYDVLGRRVALLASGALAAGRHALRVEEGRLAPGVYVVRVTAGRAVVAQPVTVLR